MKHLSISSLKIVFIIAVFSSFIIKGFSQNRIIPKTESELLTYLDAKEKVYEQYMVDLGLEYWKYYAREGSYELVKPKQKLADFFHDKTFSETITTWFPKRKTLKDSVLSRRLEIWERLYKGSLINMDDEVMALQNRVEDSVTSHNITNNQNWKETDKLTIKLIKLRNEKARKLGYKNFADAVIDLSGLDTAWFNKAIAIIDLMTYGPYKKLKDEYLAQNNSSSLSIYGFYNFYTKYTAAMDLNKVGGDSMKYYMARTFNDIGIDFDKLPIKAFLDKSLPPPMGGQGISVRIPDDFRIVVIPELDFVSRMHELGHGIHGMSIKTDYSVLKGYEWLLGGLSPTISEGYAETMSGFVTSSQWLSKYMRLDPDSITKRQELAKKYFPAYVRYYMMAFMLEIELYKNPEQNYKELSDKMQKKYLFVDSPGPAGQITSSFIVSYPVYMHNYLFAEMIAWQLHKALKDKFGDNYVFDKRTGPYLIEKLYKDGEYFSMQKRLLNATGEPLDYTGFIREHMQSNKKKQKDDN
jgi:peptidyl-dipeptidase A